jgi:hypothetical protein
MTEQPPPPSGPPAPPLVGRPLLQRQPLVVVAIVFVVASIAGIILGATATAEPGPADISACLEALDAADTAFAVAGRQLAEIVDMIDGGGTPADMDRLQRELTSELADYSTARSECRRTPQ